MPRSVTPEGVNAQSPKKYRVLHREETYVCDGELVCGACAAYLPDLTDDERAIGGESDSPSHCGTCHYPLFETFGLTEEGIRYVLETVRRDLKQGTRDDGWRWSHGWYEGLGKPASVRDWAEYLLETWHALDRRDRRTLELFLHFTQWCETKGVNEAIAEERKNAQ